MPYTKEEKRAYDAAYREKNLAKIKARKAAHYKANSERLIAESQAYHAAHPEKKREYGRVYNKAHRRANPGMYCAYTATRSALLREATVGDLSEIKEVYRKAAKQKVLRCYLCNRLIPLGDRHVDHIFPASKGGPTRPSNLAVACSKCNLKKSAKLPEEIGMLL